MAAAAVVVIGTGAGAIAAVATTADDNEQPISGTDLDRATRAALAHTGQGRVTETEVGDEESLYEVEVTLDDGSQVDVQLDQDFNLVSATAVEAEDSDDTDDSSSGT